jgi:hypothetical protein
MERGHHRTKVSLGKDRNAADYLLFPVSQRRAFLFAV